MGRPKGALYPEDCRETVSGNLEERKKIEEKFNSIPFCCIKVRTDECGEKEKKDYGERERVGCICMEIGGANSDSRRKEESTISFSRTGRVIDGAEEMEERGGGTWERGKRYCTERPVDGGEESRGRERGGGERGEFQEKAIGGAQIGSRQELESTCENGGRGAVVSDAEVKLRLSESFKKDNGISCRVNDTVIKDIGYTVLLNKISSSYYAFQRIIVIDPDTVMEANVSRNSRKDEKEGVSVYTGIFTGYDG